VKPTLPELFDHYGSDKNRAHAYGPVYQKLLEPVRDTVTGVLEIGVGIALGQKIPWPNKLLRDLTRESVTDAG
jgi:hypothetical protein